MSKDRIDIEGAMKTVTEIIQSSVETDRELHAVVMLVALKDGTYKLAEAFDDKANGNDILMNFIAQLVKVHEARFGFEPVPDPEKFQVRIIN